MSHSFTLNGIDNLHYTDTIKTLGIPDIIIEEDSMLKADGLWPRGYTHIYIDQISTRPVEVEYDNDSFNVRILSCSSPEDYNLAVKLTHAVASTYETEIDVEGSEITSYKDFPGIHDDEWCTNHSHQMINMILSMVESKQTTAKMRLIKGEFAIGPVFLAQIKKHENIYNELIKRMRIFNFTDRMDIFVPSLIILQNDENTKKVKIATLGEDVITLMSTSANAVCLSGNNREKITIATNHLIDILENNLTWIGEDFFYIDGYSGSKWKELFKKAKGFNLDDLFSVGSEITEADLETQVDLEKPISSFVERFTEDEWKKLTYAPFLAFLLVSGADGSIDKKELKAFAKSLANQQNPLMLELLESCNQSPQTILAELAGMGEEAANLLREVGEMLDAKLPENYALAYKYELLQIGKSIAEASGGFLGLGKKISEEENITLAVIAKLLGLA